MGSFLPNKRPVEIAEERNYGRIRFNHNMPTAHCQIMDGDFEAPVSNISSNGAFINTIQNFFIGQEIAMKITFPATMETHLVTGEITRITPAGAGVKFKIFFK